MTENDIKSVETDNAPAGNEVDSESKEETIPSPDEINARNAALTTGKIGDDGQGAAFFTSADVRAMSREQVRANLKKILRSMESSEF